MQARGSQGLLAADVDLCKAFDSVNRDVLWRILGLHVVPPKLINLMSELYSGTESAVRMKWRKKSWRKKLDQQIK